MSDLQYIRGRVDEIFEGMAIITANDQVREKEIRELKESIKPLVKVKDWFIISFKILGISSLVTGLIYGLNRLFGQA